VKTPPPPKAANPGNDGAPLGEAGLRLIPPAAAKAPPQRPPMPVRPTLKSFGRVSPPPAPKARPPAPAPAEPAPPAAPAARRPPPRTLWELLQEAEGASPPRPAALDEDGGARPGPREIAPPTPYSKTMPLPPQALPDDPHDIPAL